MYNHLKGTEGSVLWYLLVPRIIIEYDRCCGMTDKCGVIHKFSLIGNGLEGNQGSFCPRFIGYGKCFDNFT